MLEKARIVAVICSGVVLAGCTLKTPSPSSITPPLAESSPDAMKLQSSAFADNQPIPKEYTCDGDDKMPPLSITEIPQNTQSLAILVTDPDAPAGEWVHWLVWNIPPKTTSLDTQSIPKEAQQGMSSFGSRKYGGPCPPSGTHHYIFTLYALDANNLNISPDATKDEFIHAIEGHVIETTKLTGTYERQS